MKKSTMNISPREQKMLSILVAALIGFLLFNYVISPALANGAVLSEEKKNLKAELTRVNTLIEEYPTLKKQENTENKKLTEKYKMFFYDLNQERIEYKLDALLIASGFNITSYEMTKISAAQIVAVEPEYLPLYYPLLGVASKINPSIKPEPAPKQQNEEDKPKDLETLPMDAIPTADITLSYDNATYESIEAFIKSLENMDKSVFVRSISMSKSDTGIGGQIVLSFYSLPKPDDSDKDLLKFTPIIPKNKVNPFS